jgi:ssDNA-binding Zn-finger/Zn-ribbon topoisomerase 1
MQLGEHSCPTCGGALVLRSSSRGVFWGCSAYPRCRVALAVGADSKPAQHAETKVICNSCSAPMVVKLGPTGLFLACSTYPRCNNTKPMKCEV